MKTSESNELLSYVQRIIICLQSVLPGRYKKMSFTGETEFSKLNMDSLIFLDFLRALEDEFSIDLSQNILLLQQVKKISDIEELLYTIIS